MGTNERPRTQTTKTNAQFCYIQETCGLKGFNPLILSGIYHRDGRSSSSSPLRAAAATSAFADRAEAIFVVEPSKSAKTQTAFSGHVELVLTHAAAEEQSRCI
jgi:hypothetical protein